MNTTEDIIFYAHPRSGNVYKVALMLSLTNTAHDLRIIDLNKGANKDADFLAISPFGQLPVIQHGNQTIRQSNTILLHLAAMSGQYASKDKAQRIAISEWLFWEQDMVMNGIARRRFLKKMGMSNPEVDLFLSQLGQRAINDLERELAGSIYITGEAPTIADIAIYAYTRVAEEAGYDLAGNTNINAWLKRMESLPGWNTPEALIPLAEEYTS